MKALLSKLSKELELSEDRILDESIGVFLDKELRDASVEILKIKSEFKVSDPQELKNKIEAGKIKEHPAWEQLIYWENLNKRIRVVNKMNNSINKASIPPPMMRP